MTAQIGRTARATAATHVTGAFLPRTEARDPRDRGSLGIGLVLDVGVEATATWRPASAPRLSISADVPGPLRISADVARRLLLRRPGALHLRLRHPLPVGQGFGTSAAGARASALAVARVVGVPRRRAIEVAHLAELFGGGGLGGVAAILGGGLEVRRRPGIPPRGEVERVRYTEPVLVGVVGGPIPSPRVLASRPALTRIGAAYSDVRSLLQDPTPDAFWDASERFTDRVRLASPELRNLLRAIRRRGGRAAQAMFGRSFVARLPVGKQRPELIEWLERRGLRALEVGISRGGPTVRDLTPAR